MAKKEDKYYVLTMEDYIKKRRFYDRWKFGQKVTDQELIDAGFVKKNRVGGPFKGDEASDRWELLDEDGNRHLFVTVNSKKIKSIY